MKKNVLIIVTLFLTIKALQSQDNPNEFHSLRLDSVFIKYFALKYYSPSFILNKDTWQILAIDTFDTKKYITKKGNILIDSSYSRMFLNIEKYFIENNKIFPIDFKSYRMLDKVKYLSEYTDSSKKYLTLFSTYYKYTDNYKVRNSYGKKLYCDNCENDFTKFSRKGRFVSKILDSNGITRAKWKGNQKKMNPSKITFYDSIGKKEFVLIIVSDSIKNIPKYNDSVYIEKNSFTGIHSKYIKSQTINFAYAGKYSYIIKKGKRYRIVFRTRKIEFGEVSD